METPEHEIKDIKNNLRLLFARYDRLAEKSDFNQRLFIIFVIATSISAFSHLSTLVLNLYYLLKD